MIYGTLVIASVHLLVLTRANPLLSSNADDNMEDPSNSVQQVDLMNSDDSYDSKDSGDQEQANMIQQSFNVPEYGTSKDWDSAGLMIKLKPKNVARLPQLMIHVNSDKFDSQPSDALPEHVELGEPEYTADLPIFDRTILLRIHNERKKAQGL